MARGGNEEMGEAMEIPPKGPVRSGLGVLLGKGGLRVREGLALGVTCPIWLLDGPCSTLHRVSRLIDH